MIAVPATPATTTAVTNGANSRTEARMKKPPRRSSAPNRREEVGRLQARGAEAEGDVEIIIGNQQSWSAKRNWPMNSPPYG